MLNAGAVLLVANYPPSVGYAWWLMEAFWGAIADQCVHQERLCYLVYPELDRDPAALRRHGIRIHALDFADSSFAGYWRGGHFICRPRVRAGYLTDGSYLSLRFLWMRLWGVRRIVMHDHQPGERSIPTGWRRACKTVAHRVGLFSAGHYIAVSEFVYRRFRSSCCIPVHRCHVVHNGIEPLVQELSSVSPLTQFGIPQDAFVVVSTGRATRYKRIDFIIEVAEELMRVRPNEAVHFVHCGDGPDLEKFRRLIVSKGLQDSFHLVGHRRDVRRILPHCHVALHASTGEAFSLSILEYMSAGLPTLAPANCRSEEHTTVRCR